MVHIEDRLMDDYAAGSLSEPLLAEVEEHLLICPECQAQLVRTDELVALFREAAQSLAQPSRASWKDFFRLSSRWRVAAWAAATAVLALSVAVPLRLHRSAPATIVLASLRGPEAAVRTSARQPLRLVFDVSALAAGRVEIVDLAGKRVFETWPRIEHGQATAQVAGLPQGAYWIRVYGQDGAPDPLAEYSLIAK
jgi:anti-sigma factor RsiW